MNTKSHLNLIPLAALFALAAASPLAAQQASGQGSASPVYDYGLLGQNYTEFDLTCLRHNQGPPLVDHDYGFLYNQNLTAGLDLTGNYDWTTGSALGNHDWRQDAMAGLTGYLTQSWGRPFAVAQGGVAWEDLQNAAAPSGLNLSRSGLCYQLGGGVEFDPYKAFSISPVAYYQTFYRLGQAQFLPDHGWKYGAKAAYRLTERWSVTFDPTIDEYKNVGYMAGLALHF